MARADIYPFDGVGNRWGQRYPDWIRGLKTANGVYLIRERRTGDVVYIGESHSSRLYSTLTRHFQAWSDDWDTAGPTYDRADIDVAVIVVPQTHAIRLQDDLMCVLGPPRDNRIICAADDDERDLDDPDLNPRGYDHDIDAIVDALFDGAVAAVENDEDIPF